MNDYLFIFSLFIVGFQQYLQGKETQTYPRDVLFRDEADFLSSVNVRFF